MGLVTGDAQCQLRDANYSRWTAHMLHRLFASHAPRVSTAGSTTFSAITHATLIALAVSLTRPGAGSGVRGRLHEIATERITYVSPARLASAVAEAVRRARDAVARAAALSNIPKLSFGADAMVASIELPDIDLDANIAAMTRSWLAEPDGLADSSSTAESLAALVGDARPGATPTGGAYSPDMVERIVAPAPGNPEPAYPDALRRQGVEASFVVRFVVDTTGQVDENKIEFPTTAHRLFVESVKAALRRSRYFPAVLGGRRVAQLVQQEFRFRMVP
jgi:protein TonB